jgi:hypothetical protein
VCKRFSQRLLSLSSHFFLLQISVPHSIGVMKLVSCGGSFSVPFIFKLMNKISMTVLWRSRLNSSDYHEFWLTTKFSCPCVYLCTRFLGTCETHLWLWCLYVCSQLWRWVMYRDGMWRHWPFCCKKSSEIAMLAILDELFSLRSAAFSPHGFTVSFETCCVESHIWWAKCEFLCQCIALNAGFC